MSDSPASLSTGWPHRKAGLGSANPQSRNGEKLGPGWIEPWALSGHRDGQQLMNWAVGHIPLGKKFWLRNAHGVKAGRTNSFISQVRTKRRVFLFPLGIV